MSEICAVCGLPKELCVCETLAKEKQKIIIKVVKGKYKDMFITQIEGVDARDIKNIAKQLKHKLACGGSFKEGIIELQGNHSKKIKGALQVLGFQPDNIDVMSAG